MGTSQMPFCCVRPTEARNSLFFSHRGPKSTAGESCGPKRQRHAGLSAPFGPSTGGSGEHGRWTIGDPSSVPLGEIWLSHPRTMFGMEICHRVHSRRTPIPSASAAKVWSDRGRSVIVAPRWPGPCACWWLGGLCTGRASRIAGRMRLPGLDWATTVPTLSSRRGCVEIIAL